MSGHIVPKKTYYTIFLLLMVLLAVTVLIAYLDLDHATGIGGLNIIVALSIAFTKMMLVVLYFMHMKWSSKLTWIFGGASILWLILMLVITLADYFSRGWVMFTNK
ncbi:MAG: cytochrome C oxidase subunit IV family protein [Candidatus Kapabacteria bacterium]|nr:cytochrome C oxidase subunit IV family protein [Candidatus Kapabacteria bacterium]